MKNYPELGIQIPQVYLPKPGTDLTKWAVIACDQFTSQPEYWQDVENLVGDEPSTYNMILPEVYLEQPGEEARVKFIQAKMNYYLENNILQPREGLIYIERKIDGKVRKGIVLALDLEAYDFNKGSTSLIRATEGTIISRLPPRIKIRVGAPLEFPHILVLIDDPQRTVIEPLSATKASLTQLYDFDLMFDSGHLSGWQVNDATLEAQVIDALRGLANPQVFAEKYGISADLPVLLFAMGDGNHSLATAKAIWEKIKPEVGMNHPARYALVEIENVHDEALEFEPIHRVLFGVKTDLFAALKSHFDDNFSYSPVANADEMIASVDGASAQWFGIVTSAGFGVAQIANPPTNLAVGTLQAFLDGFLKTGAEKIDYVHGADVTCKLGAQPGNAGFYVPGMHKNELFKTVILDGALPRKTFSMGEAREKRFYVEGRKISNQ